MQKQLVEVSRSFSYKLNIPGAYESRDFFCAQKAECAPEDADKVSEQLYEFCKSHVVRSVNLYRKELALQAAEEPVVQEGLSPEDMKKNGGILIGYEWVFPPAWTRKTDKGLARWLYEQGYTNSFNEAFEEGSYGEVHSSKAIQGAREEARAETE